MPKFVVSGSMLVSVEATVDAEDENEALDQAAQGKWIWLEQTGSSFGFEADDQDPDSEEAFSMVHLVDKENE